ncbi:MAG: PD-(D/E)XK nuclease family protein, partial [Candidatus Izemoplasmatales bacterium]|nr:PD-(D/E)XK nuclease family protein [Candidatus Izemoplasmatales bacterium]
RKLIPMLPFINAQNATFSERTQAAFSIKEKLINIKMADFSVIEWLADEDVYLIEDAHLPIPSKSLNRLQIESDKTNSYRLVSLKDNLEQADFVYLWASELLDQGVNVDDIVILNSSAADLYQLHKRFVAAKIPFYIDREVRLSQQPCAIRFQEDVKQSGINTALERVVKTPSTPLEEEAIKSLQAVINKYGVDLIRDHPDLLELEIAEATFNIPQTHKAITAESLSDHFEDRQKHFLVLNATDTLLSFNASYEYFTMAELQALGCELPTERQKRHQADLIRKLRQTTNLTLAYPEHLEGAICRPTNLDLDREVVFMSMNEQLPKVFYSRDLEYQKYAKMRHMHETFGMDFFGYQAYEETFKDEYNLYDYQFKGLKASTINKLLEKKINLSATSLKLFRECPFHYLLDALLKITPKETSNQIYFGNLTHAVLEVLFAENKPLIEQIIANLKTPFPEDIIYKQDLYLECFKKQLETISRYFEDFAGKTKFEEFGHEWQHSYTHEHDFGFVVLGKIDRILTYEESGKTYYAVIDYKTGNKEASKSEFMNCDDIQLPFYLLLLKKAEATSSFIPFGFYYQKASLGRYAAEAHDDPILKQLQLSGMTLNDSTLISAFGGTDWLKSVSINADGTLSKRSRVLSESEFQEIVKNIENIVDSTIDEIKKGVFSIKPLPPKPNHNISDSCKYCPHKSICNVASFTSEPMDREAGDADE